MGKVYIGIDNGVSGSIGIITDGKFYFYKTPVKSQQDYTKEPKNVTRIDSVKLYDILEPFSNKECIVALERPMVNPGRWVATMSAIRAWEATLNVLEFLDIPMKPIDSKVWQKSLLPEGTHKDLLKPKSLEIGNYLFPTTIDVKHPDRDGILIAEYIKRKNW